MEPGPELVGEGVVDQAVAAHEALPLELGGHDLDVEVGLRGAALPDGGVPGVLVRDVLDLQGARLERGLELGPDPAGPRQHRARCSGCHANPKAEPTPRANVIERGTKKKKPRSLSRRLILGLHGDEPEPNNKLNRKL